MYIKNKTVAISSYEITLPLQALKDCFHSGSCDEEVNYWYNKINWSLVGMTDQQIKYEVDGFGMSDNKTMADYKKSILWLAASNYFEGVGI
jgi:tRNA(His) 5'-end guanylyltransferase